MKVSPEKAKNYLMAGLSVLSASKASKCPLGKWKEYQTRLPSETEVMADFSNNKPDAICLVCGKVSGNLEVIDFDNQGELYSRWKEAIPADLLKKLVIEQTQSGGYHVAYRCQDAVCGNIKLAEGERDGKKTTLIETRGEGGLILCAPGDGYTLIQGDYAGLPVLTIEERISLLDAAWKMNEKPEQKIPAQTECPDEHFTDRPGDDFNACGDVRAVLLKLGWTSLGIQPDGNEHWRRPGKTEGNSATLKDGVFYVFSSNAAPFEPNRPYNAFVVYTLLEHDGDFGKAAAELLKQGYGKAQPVITVDTITPDVPKILRPWDVVTDDHVASVLDDTILGDLCSYYSCATIPPLPLEVAILKAIVSAACALSEKASESSLASRGDLVGIIGQGPQLARLRIDTAGGQVCNAYTMTVGNSASGKDIGNLLGIAMDHYNWNLGSSGSSEGILDALVRIPNGLQVISEMKNWLDSKHYLSKAADTFTEMFSKGYFKFNLSQRNGPFVRESDYTYPNVYANIQPDIFEKNVKQSDVTSGLLSRFLMTLMPEFYGRPANFDLMSTLSGIIVCLDMFRRKSGVVKVPELYLNDTARMFASKSPKSMGPSWRRLINEYSPRFAVMLSITHDPATQGASRSY